MTDEKTSSPQKNGETNRNERSSVLEKIFTVLSLVAITALIVYLGKESIGTPPPASFEIKTGPPEKRGEFTAVEVYIKNTGEQAAKAVNVSGEIATATEPVEAEATLDWLPGNSRRKVTLIFPGDQTTTTPEVQVLGYEEP